MNSLLLIKIEDEKRSIALMEDGRLCEYHESRDVGDLKADEIYLGRVSRVMKNLQAAFIRVKEDKDGFLPFDEIPQGQPMPGDSMLVQVKKPPLSGKAAYMTARITLPGSCFALLAKEPGSKLSGRVKDEAKRKALYRLADELAPAGMGLLMQETALSFNKEDLKAEIDALAKQWHSVEEKAARHSPPALIQSAPDAAMRLLRDAPAPPEKIICNKPELLPDYGIPVTQSNDPLQLYEVEHKLRKALRRKQSLKSGATLVIDPCEAMWVIDVNTAASVSGKDKEKTLLATNIEAAEEIARLLRLRRMSGIVLIDFIDMKSNQQREEILSALRAALAKDPVKTAIHGFTSLGFLEMTRKKTESPLRSETLLPCPLCRGTGMIHKEENEDEA